MLCAFSYYEPKMPADYAKNFRKALQETPRREEIETNIAAEPLRSMIAADH
jgi:pyruvate dehydrogenase (quinone)